MKPLLFSMALLCTATFCVTPQDLQQELQQKLAQAKESAARNQAALRNYSWVAHTEISLKGEVKKTKDEACRYGPDGQVQKTELGPPAPQKELHGLKKRIVEKKKDEMEDYMERAAALIRNYVPPNPQNMQQAFQAGNVSLSPSGSGIVQLQFKNYFQSGDSLILAFDTAARTMRTLNVNSYLDDPTDVVALQVDFQTLPDGTNYPARTILNATAKKIVVTTQNSNYQRIS